jgi:hypothetical protein
MTVDIKQMVSFIGGVALGDDAALLIGVFDDQKDEPHTVVLHQSGARRDAKGLDWSARAICRSPEEQDDALIIGLEGEVTSLKAGRLRHLPRLPVRERQDRGGSMLAARDIAGIPYVVGFGRQVYRRSTPDGFTAIDHGLPAREPGKVEVSAFEAIDGFGPNEIYVCGRRGEIWRYDGDFWHAVQSPTNARLMGLCCAADGHVYICGQFGLLIQGRGDSWRVLHADQSITYLWDAAWLGDRIICASSRVLFEWSEGELRPFPFPDLPPQEGPMPKTFLRFSTFADSIWSIGEKDVVILRTDSWRRII